jgi:hypothetical protein
MDERLERCLKCGKQQGLQGVALTIGVKACHLFYLCTECGNVGAEELLKMIEANRDRIILDSVVK